MFLIMGDSYPFVPIQLSLISVVTIGIPSFILALEPNKEKIQGHFMQNVIAKAIPTGLTVAINIFAINSLHELGIIPTAYYSSLCVISTGICGIILLFTLAKTRKSEGSKLPFSIFRLSLVIILTIIFILGLTILDGLFNIAPLEPMLKIIIRLLVISIINFIILSWVMKKILVKI